jgi:hypothetical protein
VRSKLRLRVLLPVAILALMGVGFGAFAFTGAPGGDDDPLPGLQRPAKVAAPAGVKRSAWARKANAICRSLNAETAQLGTPQSRNELVQLLPQSVSLAQAALGELRALAAPKRDAKRIARMLRQFDRFLALETQAAAALGANDTESFARLTAQAFAANDRGNHIARTLGATRCSVGGTDDTDLGRELEGHRVVVAVLYSPNASVDALAIREARSGANKAGAGFVAIDVYDAQEIAPVAAEYAVRGAPAVLVVVRGRGAVTQFNGWVDSETVAQAVDNARV